MASKRIILIGLLLVGAVNLSFGQFFNTLHDIDSSKDWGWRVFIQPDNTYFIVGTAQDAFSGYLSYYNAVASADGNSIVSKKILELDDTANYYWGGAGEGTRLPSGEYLFPATRQKVVNDTLRSEFGLLKYNSAGDTLFLKKYTDMFRDFDAASCCAELPGGDCLTGGTRARNRTSNYSGFLSRINNVGDTIWTHTYKKNPSQWVDIVNVFPISGSRIVVGAQSVYWVHAWTDYYHGSPWFLILDDAGHVIKDTLYGNKYGGGGHIYKDNLGGYVHFGFIDTLTTMYPDDYENFPWYIAHLDTQFRMEWITRLPFNDNDGHRYIEKMIQLHDGSYLLVGETLFHMVPNPLAWAARVSKTGELLWSRSFNRSANFHAYFRDAAEKADGSIVMVGATSDDSQPSYRANWDLWIVGIDSNGCETMSCALDVAQLTNPVSSFAVYPNPSRGKVTINTGIEGQISLYDLSGKQLFQYGISKSNTELELPSFLSPGIYTCKFISNDGKVVKVSKLSYID